MYGNFNVTVLWLIPESQWSILVKDYPIDQIPIPSWKINGLDQNGTLYDVITYFSYFGLYLILTDFAKLSLKLSSQDVTDSLRQFRIILGSTHLHIIWRLPEMEAPLNHPFLDGTFPCKHLQTKHFADPPFMETPISASRHFDDFPFCYCSNSPFAGAACWISTLK